MPNRNFIRAPKDGYVPNTRVHGSFVRRTALSEAFAAAGLVETHERGFTLEAAIRTPRGKTA
jgi:hypothetical protein